MSILLLRDDAVAADRWALAATIREPGRLDDTAVAIAAYAASGGATVVVEADENGYRWSPAHSGGAYPLGQRVAGFLGCSHRDLIVRFTTLDGWAIVGRPEDFGPTRYAVIEAVPTVAEEVAELLRSESTPWSEFESG